MPLTPMRVWQAIQEARASAPDTAPRGDHGGAGSGRRRRGRRGVIPPEFEYKRVGSVDEAISALGQGGEDAKLLAGGHSLLPLMKLRLAAPSLLIDIGGIGELRGFDRANGGWRIGALTTHAMLQTADELGVVAHAASQIADQQVRNRGTIGGSLAHGDPASDLPTVLLALEGEVSAQGPNGQRTIAAADLFQDYLTTSLAHDEVITEVRLPAAGRLRLGLPEVHPPRRGLGDGRRRARS